MGCWVHLETQMPFHFLLMNLQWALALLRCWHLPIACGQGWLLCTRFLYAYERAWNTSRRIPTFGFRYCLCIVLVETSKQKQILYTLKCVYVCVHHLWKWHVNHRYVSMDILNSLINSRRRSLAVQANVRGRLSPVCLLCPRLAPWQWSEGAVIIYFHNSSYNFGCLVHPFVLSVVVVAFCFSFSPLNLK